jgi:hypothetical protein
VRKWDRDEIAVCAWVYKRRGAVAARDALKAGGWERSIPAIRDRMRKHGATYEGDRRETVD